MSNNDMLTDDYVADLLIAEAKDCSLKYSALGMDAFGPGRKPEGMPKPNTRFLRNVIKNTDAHNKALLAREATQSHERFKNLESVQDTRQARLHPSTGDVRRRQLGQIHAIIGGAKRALPKAAGPGQRRQDPALSKTDAKKGHGRLDRDHTQTQDSRSRRDESSRRRSRHRHSRVRDESPTSCHSNKHATRPSRRSRRSRSPDAEDTRRRRHGHRHRSRSRAKAQTDKEGSDSDPLDGVVGPAPPPKHRGRGRIGGALDLDRRFSDSYDPKADVEKDPGMGHDWDDKVEAFRDAQKLRLHREQRMRQAGFGDGEIRKMTTDRGAEPDVVWSKAGEVRAWDNGKTLGADVEMMEGGHLPRLFSER